MFIYILYYILYLYILYIYLYVYIQINIYIYIIYVCKYIRYVYIQFKNLFSVCVGLVPQKNKNILLLTFQYFATSFS